MTRDFVLVFENKGGQCGGSSYVITVLFTPICKRLIHIMNRHALVRLSSALQHPSPQSILKEAYFKITRNSCNYYI